jgi:aminoglycoside 3-N-acetyltransferase
MDEIRRRVPGLGPVAFVELVQGLLGAEGTLLMPAFPFVGRQARHVAEHPVFDVERTASKAGLISEVFRRSPGVIRSRHPAASFAGWGRHAAELLEGHHLGSAFGPTSPFQLLGRFDGIEAGVGTHFYNTFSLLHAVEELDPALRQRVFEQAPRTMTIVDGAQRIPYQIHCLREDVERDYAGLGAALIADGTVHDLWRKGLHALTARADRLVQRCLELSRQGRYLRG